MYSHQSTTILSTLLMSISWKDPTLARNIPGSNHFLLTSGALAVVAVTTTSASLTATLVSSEL